MFITHNLQITIKIGMYKIFENVPVVKKTGLKNDGFHFM